jgi:acyl-CoA thioester hydrolase
MRWADLDMLGHVNNVVYVDYLQEARVDMLRVHGRGESGDALTEGVVVVRHEVTYRAPLVFRFRPVKIECWVTEIRPATFTMAYEVFHDDGDAGRVVYLQASTVLSPYVFAGEHPRRLTAEEKETLGAYLEPTERRPKPDRFTVSRSEHGLYPIHVRFSDVDVYGHVNNVKYFEYLQESRIRWMATLTRGLDLPPMHFVVAQTDVDYRQPILFRSPPYDCWSQLGRLGNRSMTIHSEINDGDQVLARAKVTTVFYDLREQRAIEPHPVLRERLEAELTRTS